MHFKEFVQNKNDYISLKSVAIGFILLLAGTSMSPCFYSDLMTVALVEIENFSEAN